MAIFHMIKSFPPDIFTVPPLKLNFCHFQVFDQLHQGFQRCRTLTLRPLSTRESLVGCSEKKFKEIQFPHDESYAFLAADSEYDAVQYIISVLVKDSINSKLN